MIFRYWAGLSAVSGALERRCFIKTSTAKLYPNLFTLLVGKPAVGKTVAIDAARQFWKDTNIVRLAPKSITRAGLVDFLGECSTGLDPDFRAIHSGVFGVGEFGVLVPAHDHEWLNTLNDLYDNPESFETQTRGGGNITITNPHIHILSGTQPKYLGELLPEAAYGLGFTSRLFMVYAGEGVRTSIFSAPPPNTELRRALQQDMNTIAKLKGEFSATPEYVQRFDEYHNEDWPPLPTHPKLQHYIGRRFVHVLKFSMALSAAESDSLKLELRHLEEARKILLSAEEMMPQIFAEMTQSEHGMVLDETFNFIWEEWMKRGKKPVSEQRVVNFLSQRVALNQINYTIDALLRANRIKKVEHPMIKVEGMKWYEPQPINRHGMNDYEV